MLKTLSAFAALTAAVALVVPTVSQAAEHTSIRVSYADLNLRTALAQTKLQRRIAYAAETVCDTTDPLNLAFARVVADCRTGAIADAQPAYAAALAAARHPSVTVLDATALIVTAH
jgi:UrcA family protein